MAENKPVYPILQEVPMRQENGEILDLLSAARRNAIFIEQCGDNQSIHMHLEITRHLIEQAMRIIQSSETASTAQLKHH
jgi:hypothetical protein